MSKIKLTKSKIRELKIAYNEAKKNKKEIFIFDGEEILTSYAKYLIEYVNTYYNE